MQKLKDAMRGDGNIANRDSFQATKELTGVSPSNQLRAFRRAVVHSAILAVYQLPGVSPPARRLYGTRDPSLGEEEERICRYGRWRFQADKEATRRSEQGDAHGCFTFIVWKQVVKAAHLKQLGDTCPNPGSFLIASMGRVMRNRPA
jgi:hypothetical protein